MNDYSKEEILRGEVNHDDIDEGEDPRVRTSFGNIFDAMIVFADQEKRKEAIAFAEWAAEKGWLLHPDCDEDEERAWYKPSDDFDIPDEMRFGGQIYDLYLISLNPLTPQTH